MCASYTNKSYAEYKILVMATDVKMMEINDRYRP